MTTITNKETGEIVKTLDPLTYTTVDSEAMQFDELVALEQAGLLGDPHEPTSPPQAPPIGQRPDER